MRIVSLLPSATEIVCALGLEQDLVGVTHECDYPASVREKPVLTSSVLDGTPSSGAIDRHIRRLVHQGSSIYHLDADRLDVLQPELVLTQELCEVCAVSYPIVEGAVRRLDSAARLVSLEPETLDDVLQTIETIGRLTNSSGPADEVVKGLRRRVGDITRRLRGRTPRSVLCLEWIDPPYNCGHWTPELVELAGGHDLLGTRGEPARPIATDELVVLQPEVVVVMACGFSLERSIDEFARLGERLPLHSEEVWVVDGNAYFSRPGPRLVDSLEILAGILHPDLFPPSPPAATKRVR